MLIAPHNDTSHPAEIPRLMTDDDVKISRSRYRCSKCFTPPNRVGARYLSDSEKITCTGCGVRYSCKESIVLMARGSQKFLDDKTTLESFWWHSTLQKQWPLDPLRSERTPMVHVGTYNAAVDNGALYLYKVVIRGGASLSPNFLMDRGDWLTSKHYYDHAVYRYVNRYESPGSVSLLIDPAYLEVVDIRQTPVL